MKYLSLIVLVLFVTISCKHQKETVSAGFESNTIAISEKDKAEIQKMNYAKQSVDEAMANNIRKVIIKRYKQELSAIPEADKKFQFYKIDLNKDGKNEVFVRFLTPYFCGTGGCSFLLLDHKGAVITEFSVTHAPIWAEQNYINGWQVLMVQEGDRFKSLIYNNGTYPSNPSMVKDDPADYAPSGHAEIMFDDYFAKPKTYNF